MIDGSIFYLVRGVEVAAIKVFAIMPKKGDKNVIKVKISDYV